MASVPSSRTEKQVAGSPSTDTSAPAGKATTSPCSATQASCASSRSAKRNSSRSSAGASRSAAVVTSPPRWRSSDPCRVVLCLRMTSRARSSFPQVAVHEGDRHGTLADGRGDPLDRVGAHVAGDEDAGQAGLQQVRVAVEVPAGGTASLAQQGGPGRDEAALVADDRAVEPPGARRPADEDEQVAGRQRLLLAGPRVLHGEVLQVPVALGPRDAGAGAHRD